MSETRLSFKEMCAEFDVTPRTLRYYEYIELLQPDRDGRARYYGPRERARMKLILRGRRMGFSLEYVRQWLLIYEHEGNRVQLETFVSSAVEQLGELETQKRQIEDAIAELTDLRQQAIRDLAAGKYKDAG